MAAESIRPKKRVMVSAVLMAVLLALYIVAVLYRALVLLLSGSLVAAALACGMLVLSLIAIWALYREVLFGIQATKLSKKLAAQGRLFHNEITADATGRPDREAAKQLVPQLAAVVAAAHPSPAWQDVHRLGIALRAAGEAGQARKRINEAIALAKAQGEL